MRFIELRKLGWLLGICGCSSPIATSPPKSSTGGATAVHSSSTGGATTGGSTFGTAGATGGSGISSTGGAISRGGTSSTGGVTTGGGTSGTGGDTGSAGTSSAGGSQMGGATGTGNTANACTGTFTACGGDPTGTWDIASVCVEGDLAAAANVSYATDSTDCASLCTEATLAAQGSVTYNAGNFQPNAGLSLSETLEMTASCYTALFGTTWSSASCTSVAQMLDQPSGTTATCSPENSGCDCVYTTATPATADTYSVNGNLLVASDGSTTEFCVQGSTMFQRDSFGNNTYAVTQFTKR